jgi:hypothetical protein
MKTNSKLPLFDLNLDSSIDDLNKKADQLRAMFVSIGIQYMNIITGCFPLGDGDKYIHLRDSIIFRANCLLFHFNLLLNIQNIQAEQYKKAKYNSSDRQMQFLNFSEQQIFLFDSIVFHSISLFDYVGNTIEYFCGEKKEANHKWRGLAKSALDKNNKMSSYPIASEIISINSSFVQRLYDHRSDLIHYKTDLAATESSFSLMKAESKFTVFAPHRFATNFPYLKDLTSKNRVTLRYVAYWLCETTINSTLTLATKLLEHFEANRKVPHGHELFQVLPELKKKNAAP